MSGTEPFYSPNWPPEEGAYDYILELSDEEIAWEFLRRNADYQLDAYRHGAEKIIPRRLTTGQLLWRAPIFRKAVTWGVWPFC